MVYIVQCNTTHLYDNEESTSKLIMGIFKSYDSALNYVVNTIRARETSYGVYIRTETVEDDFGGVELFEYRYTISKYELQD
jgi:hypothetical protein